MKKNKSNIKIAIFHAFLKNKGGAEFLILDMARYTNADLFVGGIRSDIFNKNFTDYFSHTIFTQLPHFYSLHEDGRIPILLHIKRQLNFLFNPMIAKLGEYDVVIFSGNIFWVPQRLKRINSKTKIITYCNTPPRPFTDQEERIKISLHPVLRVVYSWFARFIRKIYSDSLKKSDIIIANSNNIKNRVKHYLNIETEVIYPPIKTRRFSFISFGDFYLSYSRLEDMKRIKHILEAFKIKKDLKLVICSSGPLKEWVQNFIKSNNLTNIEFKGFVTDEELAHLVGTCKAGITIPIEEDAGITQCEIMSAGKPVVGVAEGGLLETVLHKKTGYLINANPNVEDLVNGIEWVEKANLGKMKDDCILQAKKFDEQVFFDKLDSFLYD